MGKLPEGLCGEEIKQITAEKGYEMKQKGCRSEEVLQCSSLQELSQQPMFSRALVYWTYNSRRQQ